jgi:hypothetical protein
MGGKYPCRRFLAHRHCQDVVHRYMAGALWAGISVHRYLS